MLNQTVLDLESSRTSDVIYVRDGSCKKSLLRFCYCVLLILTNEKENDKNKFFPPASIYIPHFILHLLGNGANVSTKKV